MGETLYCFIKSDGLGTVAIGFENVIPYIFKASWLLKLRLRLRRRHIHRGFNLDCSHFRPRSHRSLVFALIVLYEARYLGFALSAAILYSSLVIYSGRPILLGLPSLLTVVPARILERVLVNLFKHRHLILEDLSSLDADLRGHTPAPIDPGRRALNGDHSRREVEAALDAVCERLNRSGRLFVGGPVFPHTQPLEVHT